MQLRKNMCMPDAMWRKCNIAAIETMGGASSSAFVRAAVHAALETIAQHDPKMAAAFRLIDESERLADSSREVRHVGRPRTREKVPA